MKTFDCEVIFDEFGTCEFFIIEDCQDEADALEKLFIIEPSYQQYKVNLYDITGVMGK